MTPEHGVMMAERETQALDGLPDFGRFLGYLANTLDIGPERVAGAAPDALPELARRLELTQRELGHYIANYLGVPYSTGVEPARVARDSLPLGFCRAKQVVPMKVEDGEKALILANPFRWDLLDDVRWRLWSDGRLRLRIAEPEVIRSYFTYGEGGTESDAAEDPDAPGFGDLVGERSVDADHSPAGGAHAIMALANELLRMAVSERASDVHIEPKSGSAVIRLRVDGELQDVRRVPPLQGTMLISRLKALGGLDIAEKRRPQDGAVAATIHGRKFKLRLATTSTPHGESLVIRLVEPTASAPRLEALGMTADQAGTMRDLAQRHQGLVLVVGPTGSGKSTTIFSLLSGIDGERRSIITVEDPVEYRIPAANQQQVNEKAGVTFDSLLRSAVRQDPDVLLVGEIRDYTSAKAALDFSSSGHLCVTTIHSSNATTAVFRLERLGVERGAMADSLLAIVAQKLLRKLCDQCKKDRPITAEEREWLAPFTREVPDTLAEPVGCPRCRGTGYHGREAIYEIIRIDTELADLIRNGESVGELRAFVRRRGEYLVSQHAVEKVLSRTCSLHDVYETVLLEERLEPAADADGPSTSSGPAFAADAGVNDQRNGAGTSRDDGGRDIRVLVVEDDEDSRILLRRYLSNSGYEVVLAEDGAAALLRLGHDPFDLILSDINMPNLDGLKLLELLGQKGVDTPVIFLTARAEEETEIRGLELGAADYLRKPIRKDLLRLRVQRVLEIGGRRAAG